MSAALVARSTEGAVGVLTFSRPKKLNALNGAVMAELGERLDELEADDGVRAVVLTGQGRAFVAGADIDEYDGVGAERFAAIQETGGALLRRLERFPKPVVGAINGYALGGGFEIALCCDVLVASASARFGLPEGRLGLCPGGGGTQRLVRAVGKHVALDVLLSARFLTAEEARRHGLVAEVCDEAALLRRALEKADACARIGPGAARAMKRLVLGALDGTLDDGLARERAACVELFGSEEAREGIAAFVEKREPRFAPPASDAEGR